MKFFVLKIICICIVISFVPIVLYCGWLAVRLNRIPEQDDAFTHLVAPHEKYIEAQIDTALIMIGRDEQN